VHYDLIFIDLILPGMHGVDVSKEIKKISPDSKYVFMSGQFDEDEQYCDIEFFQHGCNEYYIKKPFAREEVVSLILKILSHNSRK